MRPLILFFKRFYLFIFREMWRKGERDGEKHWSTRDTSIWLPLTHSQLGIWSNPGMCPNLELNRQPSSSQAGVQPTEPHQPGLMRSFKRLKSMCKHAGKFQSGIKEALYDSFSFLKDVSCRKINWEWRCETVFLESNREVLV